MHGTRIEVVGSDGARGRIDAVRWPPDRADAPLDVVFENGARRTVRPADLRPLPDGRYQIAGRDGADAAAVPIIEEHAQIATRAVDRGGVRISKSVRERRETVDVPLKHEEIVVERIAVQREVSGPLPVREEDGEIVVPLVEEVLVVRKAWVLREEVRIRKHRFDVHRPTTVTLRAEHAEVERLPAAETGPTNPPEGDG